MVRAMVVAAAAAGLLVAALLLRTEGPRDLDPQPVDVRAVFGAEAVARADAYAPAQRLLWLGGTATQLAAGPGRPAGSRP
jgi:hypothetical protein